MSSTRAKPHRFGRHTKKITHAALAVLTAVGMGAVGVVATAGTAGADPAPSTCKMEFEVPGWGAFGGNTLNTPTVPGFTKTSIAYPNAMWDFNFPYDIRTGTDTLVKAINAAPAGCEVLVVGYSLGAIVAGNALEQTYPGKTVEGIVFSDARRPASGQAGDPGGGAKVLPWSIGVPGGLRGATPNPLLSLCHKPDGVCWGPGGVLGYFNGHQSYSFNPQQEINIHWGGSTSGAVSKNVLY